MKSRFAVCMVAALALACAVSVTARAEEPAKVAGKWEITWEGQQGTVTATLNFEQKGETLKGTFTSAQGTESPLVGTVKGKEINFTVTRETPNGKFQVHYTGTVVGDTMKGTVPFGQSTREWTAKRAK